MGLYRKPGVKRPLVDNITKALQFQLKRKENIDKIVNTLLDGASHVDSNVALKYVDLILDRCYPVKKNVEEKQQEQVIFNVNFVGGGTDGTNVAAVSCHGPAGSSDKTGAGL